MTPPIVLYTNNPHKVAEITAMFNLPNQRIVAYTDVFRSKIDVVENGLTFSENAIIKVNALPPHPDYIYLAEDSGIEVTALDGEPGIYSARYAGPNATKEDMCHKLLRDCYGAGDRSAQYQAVMALRIPNQPIQTFTGIVKGTLAHEMMGDHGFGYDPIFIPDGYDITFAQMPAEDKHQLSHRFIALEQVKNALL